MKIDDRHVLLILLFQTEKARCYNIARRCMICLVVEMQRRWPSLKGYCDPFIAGLEIDFDV